jgi:hypothetical protein
MIAELVRAVRRRLTFFTSHSQAEPGRFAVLASEAMPGLSRIESKPHVEITRPATQAPFGALSNSWENQRRITGFLPLNQN